MIPFELFTPFLGFCCGLLFCRPNAVFPTADGRDVDRTALTCTAVSIGLQVLFILACWLAVRSKGAEPGFGEAWIHALVSLALAGLFSCSAFYSLEFSRHRAPRPRGLRSWVVRLLPPLLMLLLMKVAAFSSCFYLAFSETWMLVAATSSTFLVVAAAWAMRRAVPR
jgi:hypothetical protein